MQISMRDLWYKRAIVYSVDVETFMDSNGDGVGDFSGLIQRLDYLDRLGVTCLWLLPFFPTPNRDNGYDVTDYYGVDPRLGTLGDFVEFMHEAKEHGMRVVIDLVVNHTSKEHPWFQAARRDPGSRYREFYVWSEEEPEEKEDNVFPDQEDGIWSYDEEAGMYYLHRFYHHQPDLNVASEAVREEIKKVMGFWLKLGVSGFRVDAAPFLIEHTGIEASEVEVDDPYQYLRDMRNFLSLRQGDAVLLAEANVAMDEILEYFGERGDKLQMLFNFMLNQHVFLALARQEKEPLVRGWKAPPEIPPRGQWANFLRNHDELDLGRLEEEEREEVFSRFGPEEHMQLYQRGIRRRLPPMLGGDRRRLEMAYSLMFSLPGTPVLWYGEEIGMGDDLSLAERSSVRTPMQWSDDHNAGFSAAETEQLIRPVIDEGEYAYDRVNVARQRRDPDSLLIWMERVIRTRKECPEFGWGECRLVETGEPSVFAHCCEAEGRVVLAVHNLGDQACEVELDLDLLERRHLVDLLGDERYEAVPKGGFAVHLEPYGYRWFRVEPPMDRRDRGRHEPLPE
jgi:maltose alpha-D-glucosyltransferase / alpha-amylase